jgi:hypothetical protein
VVDIQLLSIMLVFEMAPSEYVRAKRARSAAWKTPVNPAGTGVSGPAPSGSVIFASPPRLNALMSVRNPRGLALVTGFCRATAV